MPEQLLSVGLDVGTTTTQMVVSRLTVENQAAGFAVPVMQITGRQLLYKSPVYFTPLLDAARVDGAAIGNIVQQEYENAGIHRQDVDTGAVIITGETSRKENAKAVLQELSGFAGDFVVATAGPDLEAVLAAKGAGAVEYSQKTGKSVLHMDIGGGTANLAFIADGKILRTGCFNVGGRLIKTDASGEISYISPVVSSLTDMKVGEQADPQKLGTLAKQLTQTLEMAAGLKPETELFTLLQTQEVAIPWIPEKPEVISFSGGVADCIEKQSDNMQFGDMGPMLGRAIKESLLCKGAYMLGRETIRATVIGAGCHSTQLSGSTVFYQNVALPVKNLPVATLDAREQLDSQMLRRKWQEKDADMVILAMPGFSSPSYGQIKALAQTVYEAFGDAPVYLCIQNDMAKALGHALCLLRKPNAPCLCIDRLGLTDDSFLDVGMPVGPALPVVIKTLVLAEKQ